MSGGIEGEAVNGGAVLGGTTVFRKRWYWESYITYKKAIRDLKMGSGIGREAMNGGAVLGGTTVHDIKLKPSLFRATLLVS